MKITFKVCFLLGNGTQGKGKLKRGYIREKNFSSGTEENTIFLVAQKGFPQNPLSDVLMLCPRTMSMYHQEVFTVRFSLMY
jgi:hypothetical protein